MRRLGALPLLLVCALPGLLAWLCAARADPAYLSRHVFLPHYFVPPGTSAALALRMALGAVGLSLLGLGVLLLRWARRQETRAVAAALARSALALVAALGAVELTLRVVEKPETETRNPRLESRLGAPDPRTGWAFVPDRTTEVVRWGTSVRVHYAVDAHGNRASAQEALEDPLRPTVLVAGESVALGHGLEWPETFAGQLEGRGKLQVVNLAEGGYGMDQAYLRLVEALPRFERPLAVVTVLLPVQLGRSLQDYRPRLTLVGGELVLLQPAQGPFSHLRLRNLWVNELPWMSEARLHESLALAQAIIERTSALSRARGATPLYLLPGARDADLERLVAREPHLVLELTQAERFPLDDHPNAAGARRIALELERALEGSAQAFSAPAAFGPSRPGRPASR